MPWLQFDISQKSTRKLENLNQMIEVISIRGQDCRAQIDSRLARAESRESRQLKIAAIFELQLFLDFE